MGQGEPNRTKSAVKVKVKDQLLKHVLEAEDTKEYNHQLPRGKDDESMKQLIEWGEDEMDDVDEVVGDK